MTSSDDVLAATDPAAYCDVTARFTAVVGISNDDTTAVCESVLLRDWEDRRRVGIYRWLLLRISWVRLFGL